VNQQIASRPNIAFLNISQTVQNLVKKNDSNQKFECSFYSLDEIAEKSEAIQKFNWDLLIYDSSSSLQHTNPFKNLNTNLPMIPWPDDDSSGEYEIQSIFNFLTLFVELKGQVKSKNMDPSKGINCPIIGQSEMILAAIKDSKRVAGSEANIFLYGESGTGKEIFAKYIHDQSQNSKGPFIAINCTAITETLLESELFGHVKGSFTGAISNKVGLFEEAEGGSLFLDEIGDLSMGLQVKLLRVIQERKIRRVGDTQYKPIQVRIISATHKNLIKEIAEGRFREDLYYRLNVIPICIPSLKNRTEDILPLALHFLAHFLKENDSKVKIFSKDAIQYMENHVWKGNVRELQNAIERAVVMADGDLINKADFFSKFDQVEESFSEESGNQFNLKFNGNLPLLSEAMEKYIEFAVHFNSGAKDKTARELGIDRKTLYKKLNHVNIGDPDANRQTSFM